MAYDHFVLHSITSVILVFEEEMIPFCNYRQNATVVGSAKVRGMAKAEAGMSIVISDKADVEYAERLMPTGIPEREKPFWGYRRIAYQFCRDRFLLSATSYQ